MRDGKRPRVMRVAKKRVQVDVRVKQLKREVEDLRAQLAEKALHRPDNGFSGSHDPWKIIEELRTDNLRLRERLGEV